MSAEARIEHVAFIMDVSGLTPADLEMTGRKMEMRKVISSLQGQNLDTTQSLDTVIWQLTVSFGMKTRQVLI